MEQELTLLTWPDYINPLTLDQFQTRFGVKVNLEIVPSAVELIDRMRASMMPPDLLCAPDYAIRELAAEGRLLMLDHARLPNLKYIEPRFRTGRAHDLEGRISVIKDWGTTGFMHRTDMVPETPRSWADFWHLAEKYSGRVSVLDSPGEVIGAALIMHGHSYNAVDAQALEQAHHALLKLKPHLYAFETNYRPLLTSGTVCVALGWNGDAVALRTSGVSIQYVVPSEGSQMWQDDWAIAHGTLHSEVAHAFLNFLLDPLVAAQEARYTGYATGNQAAYSLLDEAMRYDSSIYPPSEVLGKLEQGLPLSADGNLRRQNLWKEIRA